MHANCALSSIKFFGFKRVQSLLLKVQPVELSGVVHLRRLKASFTFRLPALSLRPLPLGIVYVLLGVEA